MTLREEFEKCAFEGDSDRCEQIINIMKAWGLENFAWANEIGVLYGIGTFEGADLPPGFFSRLCQNGQVAQVKEYLPFHAEFVKYKSFACRGGNWEVFEFLHSLGRTNMRAFDNERIVLEACSTGDVAFAKKVRDRLSAKFMHDDIIEAVALRKPTMNMDLIQCFPMSVRLSVARTDNAPLFKMIFEHFSQEEHHQGYHWDAATAASRAGSVEIMKIVLETSRGPMLETENFSGNAVKHGNTEMIDLLKAKGLWKLSDAILGAVQYGKMDQLEMFLRLDLKENYGEIYHGTLQGIRAGLDSGQIEVVDLIMERTPLTWWLGVNPYLHLAMNLLRGITSQLDIPVEIYPFIHQFLIPKKETLVENLSEDRFEQERYTARVLLTRE